LANIKAKVEIFIVMPQRGWVCGCGRLGMLATFHQKSVDAIGFFGKYLSGINSKHKVNTISREIAILRLNIRADGTFATHISPIVSTVKTLKRRILRNNEVSDMCMHFIFHEGPQLSQHLGI